MYLTTKQTTIELMKDVEAVQAALKRIGDIPHTVEEINTKRRKINNKLIKRMMLVLIHDDQEDAMRLMVGNEVFGVSAINNIGCSYPIRSHP